MRTAPQDITCWGVKQWIGLKASEDSLPLPGGRYCHQESQLVSQLKRLTCRPSLWLQDFLTMAEVQ